MAGTRVGFDREYLVDLCTPVFESGRATGHVQAPDTRPCRPDLRDCVLPRAFEVVHPRAQGQRVVLTEALDMARLEPCSLNTRHDRPDLVQLAVGKHVPVDEPASREARTLTEWPADPVVEQSAARPQQRVQSIEVLGKVSEADVFEHADRTDRVEGRVADLAIVLLADVDEVREPSLRDGVSRPLRLTLRQIVTPTACTP